jgi:hypothetical protein
MFVIKKQRPQMMKYIKNLLLPCCFLTCGTANSPIHDSGISSVRFTYIVPALGDTGEIGFVMRNFLDIFYYRDLVLFKFNADSTVNKEATDQGFLMQSEFLIHQKGSLTGFFHDRRTENRQVVKVDSILRRRGYLISNLDVMLKSPLLQNVESKKSLKGDSLIEIYVRKPNTEDLKDSVIAEYSASLNDIDFSLSRELDSSRKMKLVKIRIVNDAYYNKQTKATMAGRQIFFQLSRLIEFDRNEISNYFTQFSNQKSEK